MNMNKVHYSTNHLVINKTALITNLTIVSITMLVVLRSFGTIEDDVLVSVESSSLTDSTSLMLNNVVKSIVVVFVLLAKMLLCSLIIPLSTDNSMLSHCVTFVVMSQTPSAEQYLEARSIGFKEYHTECNSRAVKPKN